MVIDFHTHFFPDRIAINTIQYLRKRMMQVTGTDMTADEAFPIYTDATYKSTFELMDRSNIDKFVLLPIATNERQSTNVNNYAESMGSDRVIPFGSVYPFQKDWEYVLDDLHDRGFQGIKLHPEGQQFYIDGSEGMRVLKKADRLGLIVVIHAGADPGYTEPYHSSPQRIANVIKEVDGSRIIAAHMGGLNQWDDVERYLVGTSIHMDTSYISKVINFSQYRRIIENHGADKIVFGSDCPWQEPQEALKSIYSLGLDGQSLDLITHKNAERLLGILPS